MPHVMTAHNQAILSSKGQVVIPKALREQLGIHTGNTLIFKVRSNGVLEIKAIKRSIEMFFGRCKQTKKATAPLSIQEMDEAIMQAVSDTSEK